MENFDDVIKRLMNHANLPIGGQETNEHESVSWQLWAADKQKVRPNLSLLDDVIGCLDLLNRHFNGPDPDNRSPDRPWQPIPNSAAYAVARILSSCLSYYRKWASAQCFPDETLSTLLTGTHKIAFGWEQLLAGDVSNLLEGFESTTE